MGAAKFRVPKPNILKQGLRAAGSRPQAQTNKFFRQNREAITEVTVPVTTTIVEAEAYPAAHAERGR
jgi:hypothetical protein